MAPYIPWYILNAFWLWNKILARLKTTFFLIQNKIFFNVAIAFGGSFILLLQIHMLQIDKCRYFTFITICLRYLLLYSKPVDHPSYASFCMPASSRHVLWICLLPQNLLLLQALERLSLIQQKECRLQCMNCGPPEGQAGMLTPIQCCSPKCKIE